MMPQSLLICWLNTKQSLTDIVQLVNDSTFSHDVTLGNLYHLKLQVFGVCATLHLSGSYIPVYLPGACVVVRLQGLMYCGCLTQMYDQYKSEEWSQYNLQW